MIRYSAQAPAEDQFASLFETTGWNQVYRASPEELIFAVSNSWYMLAAYDGAQLVGFGRIVSDRVLHAMIYDLIVRPDYQDRGIGGEILERLVAHCRAAGIRDIQLFCARGKLPFYEKRGFVSRPQDAPGMQYCGLSEKA